MTFVKNKEPIIPTKTAFMWVQGAHKLYITARFLFMKGFHYNGVLLGEHALELYLKAFLIHKTGVYTKGHELADYYKECMALDSFFENDSLSKYFLPEKAQNVLMPELWENYRIIRYPESLPSQNIPDGFGVHSGSDTAGTFESLDCIAHFMHKAIPCDIKSFRQNIVTGEMEEAKDDVIDDFLKADGYYWSLGTKENASELIDLFLLNNRYFTSPKS